MERKVCTHCNIEKKIGDFYNNYTKCKICNSNRNLKRYYENKDKTSNQRKLYSEKNRDNPLQKQNNRYMQYYELHRSYVELRNKLKTLEEKLTKVTQKTIKNFIKEIYSKPLKNIIPQTKLMFIISMIIGLWTY